MAFLKFLFGKNLSNVTTIQPGALYLDTGTKELFFDDPSGESQEHNKIIDTSTLMYTIDGEAEVELPAAN